MMSSQQELRQRHLRKGILFLLSAVGSFTGVGFLISYANAHQIYEGGPYYIVIPLLLFGFYCLSSAYGLIFFGRGGISNVFYCPHCRRTLHNEPMEGETISCPHCKGLIRG